MSYLFTIALFVLAACLAATIGFAANALVGYALAGGVIMLGIEWLRGV